MLLQANREVCRSLSLAGQNMLAFKGKAERGAGQGRRAWHKTPRASSSRKTIPFELLAGQHLNSSFAAGLI